MQPGGGRSPRSRQRPMAGVGVEEVPLRRYPVPHWQFTLSATQANTEASRLARATTGRDVIVLFQGHYHGHFEENLVDFDGGGQVSVVQRGLSKGVTGPVRIAQFNDADTRRQAPEPGDAPLVLTEPPRPTWIP